MTFADLLQELEIPFKSGGEHVHVTEGWLGLPCPICHSNDWHLGYNIRGGYMNCWHCGQQNVAWALAQLSGKPLKEVYRLVEKVTGRLPKEEVKSFGKYQPPRGVGDLKVVHWEYLNSRGFDPKEIVRLWHVGGMGLMTELPWRLFIPIHRNGKPVSWTARSIGSKEPRYIAASPERESVPRSQLLYGEDYVRHTCLIVEGPTDVWAIGPGAVATLGAAVSRAQIARMAKYPVRVVVGDTDEAGAAWGKLATDLSGLPGETYRVKLESGKDAASCDREEIRELRKRFLE